MKKEDLQRHIETQLRNIMCADVDIGNCIDAAINRTNVCLNAANNSYYNTLEDYLCYTGDDDHNAMVSRFLSVVRKEQRDRLEWLRVWGDECVFMEENPDQIRHNADKLYLNVKKMMVYMMEATKEMCLRIDHMENLQGRSFADDILPGYQSEEELEALEEQRQKEQRKSFWSSLFGKKEK